MLIEEYADVLHTVGNHIENENKLLDREGNQSS
jgi:hypothetical protein